MSRSLVRLVFSVLLLVALAPPPARADPRKAGEAVTRQLLQQIAPTKPVGNYWKPEHAEKRDEVSHLIGELKEKNVLGPGPHYNGLGNALTNLISKDGQVRPFTAAGRESANWKGVLGSLNVAREIVAAETPKLRPGERLVVTFETRDATARGKEWAADIYKKEFKAGATDVRQTDVVVQVVRDRRPGEPVDVIRTVYAESKNLSRATLGEGDRLELAKDLIDGMRNGWRDRQWHYPSSAGDLGRVVGKGEDVLRAMLKPGYTEARLEMRAAVQIKESKEAVEKWKADPANAATVKRLAAEPDAVVRDAVALYHARAGGGLFRSYQRFVPPNEDPPRGSGGGASTRAADVVRSQNLFKDLNTAFGGGDGGGNRSGSGSAGGGIRSGGGVDRGIRFDRSLSFTPIAGGVVLGNRTTAASGVKPTAVRFVQTPGGPKLDITLADGRTVRCDAMTATELWCAYHVVRPTPEMKRVYGVSDGECNLVSCTEHPALGGQFALHPALHDTPVGRHAMALDLILDLADDHTRPVVERRHALQWCDAPSHVDVTGSTLRVRPPTGPAETLLRLRFWGLAAPVGVKGNPEHAVADAHLFHAAVRLGVTAPPGGTARPYLAPSALTDPVANREVMDRIGANLPSPTDDELSDLFERHECVRQVDRFARALAVVRWLSDALGDRLPPLPGWVRPVTFPLSATMSRADLPPPPPSDAEQRLREAADVPPRAGDRERWETATRDGRLLGFRRITERTVGTGAAARVETRVWAEYAHLRGSRQVRTVEASALVATAGGAPVSYLHGFVSPTDEGGLRMDFGPTGRTVDVLRDGQWARLAPAPRAPDGAAVAEPAFDPAHGLALTGKTRRERRVWIPGPGTGKVATETLTVVGPERVPVGAGTRTLTRVERVLAGPGAEDRTTTLWLDADGLPVRCLEAGLVEWAAIPKPADGRVRLDTQVATAVPCEPPLTDADGTAKLVVRVHFTDPDSAAKLTSDPRQKVLRRTATAVDLELLDTRNAVPGGPGGTAADPAYTKPEFAGKPLGPAVRKRADEFLPAGVTDPWAVVRAFESETRRRLGTHYGKVRSNPDEIAGKLEGSCHESAILMVCLCRAKGVPARYVSGLTYDPDATAFFRHAWAEVWVGGGWVPVDATLGRGGAPATHIRWATGLPGPTEAKAADFPAVQRVEVLSAEHRPAPRPAARTAIKVEAVKLDAAGRRATQQNAYNYCGLLYYAALISGEQGATTLADANRFGRELGLPAATDAPAFATNSRVEWLNALVFVRHRWGADARDALRRRYGEPVAAAYDLRWLTILLRLATATGRADPNWPEIADLVRETAATAGRAGWPELEAELTDRLRPASKAELTAPYLRGVADRIDGRMSRGEGRR